jgi:hypothetical protein
MAAIHLFYLYRSVKAAKANKEEGNSAGMAWLDERSRTLGEFNKVYKIEGSRWSDSMACHKELRTWHEAVLGTLDWAQKNKKTWQVVSGNSDEDGNLRIAVPRPGKYILVIRGRAGFNEGFWTEDITIDPGKTTTVKLSSPEKSCLVVE